MTLSAVIQSILSLLATQPLATFGILFVPFALILADLVTGVIAACASGKFEWSQLANFLGTNLEKYIIAVGLVFLMTLVFGSGVATLLAATFSLGPLALSILASIGANVKAVLPKAAGAAIDQGLSQVEQIAGQLSARTPYALPSGGVAPSGWAQIQSPGQAPIGPSVGQMVADVANQYIASQGQPSSYSMVQQQPVQPGAQPLFQQQYVTPPQQH